MSNIEDIYPLSPIQKGMLFHSLSEPEAGVYVNQFSCVLHGGLDATAFRRAWQLLVARHTTLRTAFLWEGLKEPHQVVRRHVDLPWEERSWRDLSLAERERERDALFQEERRRGFHLAKAPLLRPILIDLGEGAYQFLLTYHHLLLDGWSFSLLLQDLSAAYEAASRGLDFAPSSPRAFGEYMAWLAGRGTESAESFWRGLLAGFTAPTALPASPSVVGAARGPAQESPFLIQAATARELEALARRRHLTLNTIVQGAWALLLGRYSGEDDVVYGITVSGRPPELKGAETIVGLFINTLPVRVRIPAEEPLGRWLERLQALQVELRQHEHTPLERIQAWSAVPRGVPLFESLFVFENYPAFKGLGNGRSGVAVQAVRTAESTNYPLSLLAMPAAGGLALRLIYDPGRFDVATILRLQGHLEILLAAMAQQPDSPLASLSPLTLVERHQLVCEWNDTSAGREVGVCLHHLVEARAEHDPGAVAVVGAGEELTFGELEARANQVAHHLRELGVGEDAPVSVCAHRSLELVVALLGILKAGAAYLPLDPEYPRERLAFLVRDALRGARVPVVLCQSELADRLPPDAARLVRLDADWPEISRHSDARPAVTVSPDSLAYVIYTSGSTGQPKGVMNTHRGIVNRLLWMQRACGLDASDRVLQKTPYTFDVSVWEFFWPLLSGSRLVLARPGGQRDAAYLVDLIERQRITAVHFVPSMLNAFLEEPGLERCASLRRVICSGEALPVDVAERCLERLPGSLFNYYGPTEAAIDVTAWSCRRGDPRSSVPIGRPGANVSVYVLGADRSPVPLGVSGELAIGGVQVARGYLGRPDLTAERFVPDPFASVVGSRLYRTGDLVRRLPSGDIEFLGRIDHQVKIRGFRIELGEIEATLRRHPGVREAAVAVHGEPGGPRLPVAYVVPSGDEAPAEELRRFLSEQLPEHMVPATFVTLPALPLSSNGKVDRKALPAPVLRQGIEASFVPPRSEAERQLAELWCEVLRLDRVGIHDDFLALGGDSILGLQIAARASRCGLRFSPKQVFELRTIARLAANAGTAVPPVAAAPGEPRGAVPLTPVQRWFLEQELPDPHHFNQSVFLALRRAPEPGELERAVAALLEHHDALWLRFARREGGWHQEHAPRGGVLPLVRIDLTALPEPAGETVLASAAAVLQGSLDLEHGPVLRAALFDRVAGEPPRLLLIAHHLVVDGISWRILLADLALLLGGGGSAAVLPAKTTSFQTWAERLAERACSGGLEGERQHWLSLGAAPPPSLPADGERGNNLAGAARSVSIAFDPDETRNLLQSGPRVYRARLEDLLLAALVEAVGAWTGARRLLCDLEGHGREEIVPGIDLSRTVGWLTAIYPVLLDLEGVREPRAALRSIKEQLRAVPGRGLGFGLLRWLGSDAELSRALADLPQPEILFNYLGQLDRALAGDAPFTGPAVSTGPERSPRQPRQYRLEVNALISDGRLRVSWTYDPGRHRRETIERLAESFALALRALGEHCRAQVLQLCTPSDFPAVRLSQDQLDRVAAALVADGGGHQIESLHPLTPVQQGMLYESLAAPGSGVHIEQWACRLRGPLDLASFERAWKRVMERHSILRSAFVWEDLPEPLQAVLCGPAVPIERCDWRGRSAEACRQELEARLAEDRRRGFDLSRPPAQRLALFQTADDAWELLWTHHHILMDGWCRPLVLREVLRCYEAEREGREPEVVPSCPYGDYVEWLRRQDLDAAESYWRRTLAGFETPTPPGRPALSAEPPEERYGEVTGLLGAAESEGLQRFARQRGLTLSTLLQAAWALLLARYSRRRDVLFGITVSGRPAELPHVETAVGLFINTLPLRCAIDPERPLSGWLQEILTTVLELRQHEHTPSARVRRCSPIPAAVPLYESLLVFENYPLPVGAEKGCSLAVEEVRTEGARTRYPVTVIAQPGPDLDLRIVYDGQRLGRADAQAILEHLHAVLGRIAADPEQRIAAFLAAIPEEQIPRLRGTRETARLTAQAANAAPAPPRTPVEEVLAAIWTQVLGIQGIGVDTSFFALGGHSLLAAQMVSRIREALRVDLSLRSLLASPTIAALAAEITALRGKQSAHQELLERLRRFEPDREHRFEPFPLTDIQQAYWVGRGGSFELGNVSTHLYSELEALHLDVDLLERCWRHLIDRHDMLRAVVRPEGRQQVLAAVPAYRIERHDLRGLPEEEVAARLSALREEMSHQVLPSDRWPLFEIRASLLDGGRIRLHVSFDLLIGDGWSCRILLTELLRLYLQGLQGLQEAAALPPPLEITFRDYVLAEAALQESEAYRLSRLYWQERLVDLPPAPELPLAKRPGSLTHTRFVRRASSLAAAPWQRLKERGGQCGLTPSGLLLAAFSEVLALWSKNRRFTLNLTLFHRIPFHPQVDAVVGDFTSLTLLAIDASTPGGFEARARRIQEQLWDDLDHRYYSGVQVLRDLARLQASGAVGMPVVFTSALVQGSPAGTSEAGEERGAAAALDLSSVFSLSQTAQVWLDHQVCESPDGELLFWWDAIEELFPAGLLDAMFTAYQQLLASLASGEEVWQERLQGLVPTGQLAVRAAVNATAAPLSPRLLHELFADRAREAPERVAVIAEDRTLTYGEVARRSGALARRLRNLGVRPNELVAVVMHKGWEQVVAVLAILQAGGAYMPVDAELPPKRLLHLLARGEARIALTQPKVDARIDWPSPLERIVVAGETPAEADAELASIQGPHDLAYVIFTSGSTGLPKGVMIDHQGAVNTVLDINERFRVGPSDRVLALSSLSFDLSVYDVFGMLAAGGALVIPPRSSLREPEVWAELMKRHGITVWNAVPALMQMLVETFAGESEARIGPLRLVMLSGDWIPVAQPDRIRALAGRNVEVVSLGGATEASIWSILHPIAAVDPSWTSIPYGRPMRNQSFQVLDADLEPRPDWVPGDLYIAGAGLAQGYWRDEEKTAASFFVHPCSGERLYRTGDLGRYLPNGDIEFLGREDFQVKIGGHRIELGEIETALEEIAGIRSAVATAVGEDRFHRRLVAYVVLDHPAAKPVAETLPARPGRLHGELEKLEHKLRQPGLRRDCAGRPAVALDRPAVDEAFLARFRWRRSHREMAPQALPVAALGGLLDVLAGLDSELACGALRLHLWVKPDRVEGLAGGAYSYDATARCLEPLGSAAGLDRAAYASVNQPIFDQAAFALFLTGTIAAEEGRQDDLLAAGSLGQLLMETAATHTIGLCPIGEVDESMVLPLLRLDGSRRVLHSFLGGALSAGAAMEAGTLPVPARASVPRALSADTLAGVLSCLLQVRLRDVPLPKYRYPSAGNLYPVQAYVAVPPDGVDGVEPGVYYHQPEEHRLVRVSTGLLAAAEPASRQPGFALFLVGRLSAVEPIYGDLAEDFCWLEAGYMRQLLHATAAEHGVSLQPSPRASIADLRAPFDLDERHVLLQGFFGSAAAEGDAAPVARPQAAEPRAATRSALAPRADLLTQIRLHLEERLPSYMIPSAYVVLDELPLTANGKVDRKALPMPGEARVVAAAASYVAPRSEMERILARMLEEVLGVQGVGVEDNFFDLGGTSLHMVQIHNRIQQELGREIRIADFFKYPNIASLAGAFSQSRVERDPAGEISEVRDLAQRQKQALRKQKATMKERLRAHE